MNWDFLFFANSVLLGIGLAMDAFSVSLANGLNEPGMKKSKTALIAATFGFFQTLMPLIGWACVHTIATAFAAFRKFIPWIALALLGFIGGKMLAEGLRRRNEAEANADGTALCFGALIVQGIATAIDALSVGFTISELPLGGALTESLIIGAVTMGLCLVGLFLGKKFGTKLTGKSAILGGAILIAIGLEIFIKGIIT